MDDERGWSDSSARAVLQLMVEAVAEMIGFEVAALSVVLDGQLVTVAYFGPEEHRDYLEQPDAVSVLDPVLDKAEVWERFRFLAAEDYDPDSIEGHWVSLGEARPGENVWQPDDVLLALLHDDDRLVGVLSVDRPTSGQRPVLAQRRLLERYAAQAERALVTAFEREDLVAQIGHAETARRLIRSASITSDSSLEVVLHDTHRPLLEGFRAVGSWIQLMDGDVGHARRRDGEVVSLSTEVSAMATGLAPTLWAREQVLVVDEHAAPQRGVLMLDGDLHDLVLDELDGNDAATVLGVPLGAGAECIGFLALFRRSVDPPWSSVEIASARQIGHDLGAALVTARALERERRLVSELQQLDDHRSRLISTLSHELRTPLTVISGNLELLGGLALDDDGQRFHQAMTRGTTRMQKVVDDLLLLATVSDPQHPLERRPVDLRRVIGDVAALVGSTAQAKELVLTIDAGVIPLVVSGDHGELDRLLGNLLSNAVKYTPEGGSVVVTAVRRGPDVVLEVRDDGLGISEEDQATLFRAFFRSTNPVALREQGTGLGLAIVATIVERHGGQLDVRSTLGQGTTFTVTLPVAA